MLHLFPIRALSDNYVWVIERPGCTGVAVIDPGAAAPVLDALARRRLEPTAILITHHHGDHTGGLQGIVDRFPVPVYGPSGERIPGVNHSVGDGDVVGLGELGLDLEVLAVPGHTAGHVAYTGGDLALTGDTLFAGGCGRVFEGTHAQMYDSLSRLAALPPATEVYCAHEYTLANLVFAGEVEPDNADLTRRLEEVRAQRARGEATLPSTVELELATNPFLRCQEPAVVAAAERHTGRAVAPGAPTFAVVRSWKDAWR